MPYEEGRVNGIVRDFHPDGSLRRILPYRNNQQHGIQEQYDREGNLVMRRYWINGDMVAKGKFDREYEE